MLRTLNNTSGLNSTPRTPESEPLKLEKPSSSLQKYEEMILSMNMRLESLDMNTCVSLLALTDCTVYPDSTCDRMTSLPVSHLSDRCAQCGARFPDTEGVMQAHLDWHFRRNRKQRESEGRGAHRRWLPRAEVSWRASVLTHDMFADIVSSNGSKTLFLRMKLDLRHLLRKRRNLNSQPKKIAALKKKHVKVPSDPAVLGKPCPICKEPFKAEWSEEDEEWQWKNAINLNEKVGHSTDYLP